MFKTKFMSPLHNPALHPVVITIRQTHWQAFHQADSELSHELDIPPTPMIGSCLDNPFIASVIHKSKFLLYLSIAAASVVVQALKIPCWGCYF